MNPPIALFFIALHQHCVSQTPYPTTPSPQILLPTTPASSLRYNFSTGYVPFSQLNPDNNMRPTLECFSDDTSNVVDDNTAIAYYRFSMTKDVVLPVTFSSCFGDIDTFMYLMLETEKNGEKSFTEVEFNDDTAFCMGAIITRKYLDEGNYIIALGLYGGFYDGFISSWNTSFTTEFSAAMSMKVTCSNEVKYTPGDKEFQAVLTAIILSACCCCGFFLIFYCRQMKKYKAAHPSQPSGSGGTPTETDTSPVDTEIIMEYDVDEDEDAKTNKDELLRKIVNNILESTENENDLDIYQILAFRKFHAPSYKLRTFRPFETIGINYEFLKVSHYHRSLFVAVVTGILQIVGITIILISSFDSFFDQEDERGVKKNRECSWTKEDWENSWSFKCLAFLWSVVITLKINIDLKRFRSNGFTQIVDRVAYADYWMYHSLANLNIVQAGYLINLYTLFCAVIGSYFVIYKSEDGSGALDMVLNAMALFFMCELDDLLVTDTDYQTIRATLTQFLNNNHQSEPIHIEKDFEEETLKRLTMVSVVTHYIAYGISLITIGCGMVAPWIIFLCYGRK